MAYLIAEHKNMIDASQPMNTRRRTLTINLT